jgi:DNA-binding transcriptional regulator WhiA
MITPYETEENQPEEVSVNKESKEKKTKQYCLQKYNGAEAILVNHKPLFLQVINGNSV